jgi:hypothetical protein
VPFAKVRLGYVCQKHGSLKDLWPFGRCGVRGNLDIVKTNKMRYDANGEVEGT